MDIIPGIQGQINLISKDGIQYILKATNLSGNTRALQAMQEASILQFLSHPGIINLLSVTATQNSIQIEIPYIPDTLKYRMKQGISRIDAISIAHDLLSAIDYLHQNHIIHGDIHADNILIDGQRPILIDFGLSKCFVDENHKELYTRDIDSLVPILSELLDKNNPDIKYMFDEIFKNENITAREILHMPLFSNYKYIEPQSIQFPYASEQPLIDRFPEHLQLREYLSKLWNTIPIQYHNDSVLQICTMIAQHQTDTYVLYGSKNDPRSISDTFQMLGYNVLYT